MSMSKPLEMLASATAAGVGGMIATSTLYPLDTLKTRMQSSTKTEGKQEPSSSTNDEDLWTTVRSLYRGIQYKTAESTTSKFLYFYAYTFLSQVAAQGQEIKSLSTSTNLFIGYLAEFVHLPLTLPMEVIATRLQTSKGSTTASSASIWQIIQTVKKESGLSGFYKGFRAYFVLCLQPAIQYTVFERVKTAYLRRFKQAARTLSAFEAFLLGALARSIATVLLFPYIRAKVLLQSKNKQKQPEELASSESRGSPAEKEGIVSTLQQVYRDEGILALYRGLGPELTRGALSSAIMLMIKEKIQSYVMFFLMLTSAMYQ